MWAMRAPNQLTRYLAFMQKRPKFGAVVTAGVVGIGGDFTSQVLFPPQVGGNSSSGGPATPDPAPTPSLTLGSILPAGIDAGKLAAVNLHRIVEVVTFQLLAAIPMQMWFRGLEIKWNQRFPIGGRYSKPFHIVTKLLFHQTCFATMVNTLFFGWVIGVDLGPRRLAELPPLWQDKVVADLPRTMLASCVFWLPWSGINFSVIPLPGRVAWASVGTAIWLIYLSAVGHNAVSGSDECNDAGGTSGSPGGSPEPVAAMTTELRPMCPAPGDPALACGAPGTAAVPGSGSVAPPPVDATWYGYVWGTAKPAEERVAERGTGIGRARP